MALCISSPAVPSPCHTVPCSPFLNSNFNGSPASEVPDIDKAKRNLFFPKDKKSKRKESSLSRLLASPYSPAPQRLPKTPKTPAKDIKITERVDQVVPSCSPQIDSDSDVTPQKRRHRTNETALRLQSHTKTENEKPEVLDLFNDEQIFA